MKKNLYFVRGIKTYHGWTGDSTEEIVRYIVAADTLSEVESEIMSLKEVATIKEIQHLYDGNFPEGVINIM